MEGGGHNNQCLSRIQTNAIISTLQNNLCSKSITEALNPESCVRMQFNLTVSHTLKKIILDEQLLQIPQWLSADLFKPHMDSVVGFPGISNTSYPPRITSGSSPLWTVLQSLHSVVHYWMMLMLVSKLKLFQHHWHYVSSVGSCTCRVVQGARWCLLAQLLHITQSDSLFYTVACWDLETLTNQSELLFSSFLTILGFCRVQVFVSIQVSSVKTHMVLQSA